MTSKAEYGYVKFLGDYSKLKGMGFTFQKLYASNYMQWEKNSFRVWKKGAELEHDDYNLFKLITFLRTNPEMKVWNNGESFWLYKFHLEADESEWNYYPYSEENHKKYGDWNKLWIADDYDEDNPPAYLGTSLSLGKEVIDFIKEWDDMGWIELDYFPHDECDCDDCGTHK